MRTLPLLLAALVGLTAAGPADAGGPRVRDSERVYRGVRQGDILPLRVIRDRVQVPGAEFIGADLIDGGARYRLRFMRGARVLWVDVDARTGRVVGRAGF